VTARPGSHDSAGAGARGAADDVTAGGGNLPAETPPTPVLPPAHPTRRGMFGVASDSDTSGYGRLVQRITNPALLAEGSPRPYGGWHDAAVEALAAAVGPGALSKVVVHRGELTVFVRREHLLDVMRALRDDPALRFELCLGVSGVHYPHDEGAELHLVWPLLSISHNRRVRVETTCPDADPHVPSVVSVYPADNWHERETWDFFGVVFDAHPALTRIEMPDDWPGHPQRKDYPLGGVPVEYKGATIPPPDQRRAYS
jgi:NADH-quinone oxidoreductase subunit C